MASAPIIIDETGYPSPHVSLSFQTAAAGSSPGAAGGGASPVMAGGGVAALGNEGILDALQRLAQARIWRAAGMGVADTARRAGYRSPSALTAALRREALGS